MQTDTALIQQAIDIISTNSSGILLRGDVEEIAEGALREVQAGRKESCDGTVGLRRALDVEKARKALDAKLAELLQKDDDE